MKQKKLDKKRKELGFNNEENESGKDLGLVTLNWY
jgi:hypothetical protein